MKEKNGKLFVPAWCTRGISIAIHSILIMQVSYYATESAGLSIELIGALILGARIFDGFTDIFAGYMIDHTHTKLGKARPYELFVIPTWIVTALLFSTPEIGTVGKAAWIFITYVLIQGICTTFLGACDAVFLARATTDDNRRARALTAAGISCMLFPSVISIILPILIENWGPNPGGWTKISLAIGIPAMLFGLIRFFYVKEMDVTEEKVEKISLKLSIKCLLKNKYIWIFGLAYLMCSLATNIGSVVSTYYFTYIVGDLSVMALIGMMGLFSPLILLLFPVAMRKIGGMAFVKIGLIVAIVGCVMKYFAGTNIALLLISTILSGIGTTGLIMMGSMFIIQCMDYGEWKTGTRIEGMMNTVPSFAGKVGTGVASGLAGAIMGAAGYVGGANVQTTAANTAIVWCFSLIPAIICIIALIALHFYDYEKIEGNVQKELQERRSVKQV